MVDRVDERIREWAESELDGIEVSLDPPDPSRDGPGISIYLFQLVPAPPARGTKRPPLQINLRYLVTTYSETRGDAHRMLGELAFAAMANPEFEVELDPLGPDVWLAFGINPLPSFILSVPLRKEQPEPDTKLVYKPLVVKTAAVISLHGLVLGPEDIPLPSARIEIPHLQVSERTDREGRFCFLSVPSEPRMKLLRVKAKGKQLDIEVDQPTSKEEPFVIRFDSFE
ncbi:MAG: DUF4255 domain-containing protein [Anaerolineales bacterium]|nr:DUF4255 domain-containing protein [Anaerolineales bacterium]